MKSFFPITRKVARSLLDKSAVPAWVLLIVLPSWLHGQAILTLEEALAEALRQNYDILIAENNAEIADNNVTLGAAGFLPRITANAGDSRSVVDSKQSFLSGNVIDRKGAESKSKNAAVTLNWTLFDGFEMFISHAKLRELRQLGDLQLKARIESTVEQVAKAYYDVVQQKARLNSLRDVERLSEERYKIVESQYGFGSSSKLDLLNALVDLNTDRSAVLRQEVVLTNAKTTLNQLLSRQPSLDFETADSIAVRDDLQPDELFERARENNTEVRAALRNRRLAALDVRSLWSERLPVISATASYSVTRSQSQSGFINRNETEGLNYGLTLSYPLFDGFNLYRRQQNAELARRNSDLVLQKTLAQVESEMTRAFQRYQNALMQVRLEKENERAAFEHMNIAFGRYKVGTLTALEWREAQLKHLQAMDRLIAARYQAKTAEIDLLRLSGALLREKP